HMSAACALPPFAGIDQLWLPYTLVAASSVVGSVNVPARRTFLARLLPVERVPAGAALNTLALHGALTVGPALAGVIARAWGLKGCYVLDAVGFRAALYGVGRLPAMAPQGGASRPRLPAGGDGGRVIAP